MNCGRVNSDMKLEEQGITGLGIVHYNLLEPSLMEVALKAGEGALGQGGTFLVSTGKYTGRSPKDKFVVRLRKWKAKSGGRKPRWTLRTSIFYIVTC